MPSSFREKEPRRGTELLLTAEYGSPQYQRLLGDALFGQLLNGNCPPADSWLGSLPGWNRLNLLYDSVTYTDQEAASKLNDGGEFLLECEWILKWYSEWWLDGEIGRREEMPSEEEVNMLRAVFRALFFSVARLSGHPPAKPILLDLVKKMPKGTFDGLDLFLQRQGALALYKLSGLTPFLSNLDRVRASLLYHIDLKTGLTQQQKKRILQVVCERPEADQTDDFLTFTDWLTP
jgi:hypothetical protein